MEIVLNSDPRNIKDLGNKLILLTKSAFGGFKVYNDKLSSLDPIGKQTIYRLWMHCRRKFQALTLQNLLEAFPYQADNLRMWDRFVDGEGLTTLNREEYAKFRKEAGIKTAKRKA